MCQLALQQSPLAHHPSSPCSIQFCDFDIVLLKFCFIKGPYTIRFSKFTLNVELGSFGHSSSILEKKNHIFLKYQGFQKS